MLHIKKIKPLFGNIVTTGNKYTEDMRSGGLITAKKGDLKLYQTVLAVGSLVRDIQPGDVVMIDASHFERRMYDKNSLQNDLDNNKIVRYEFNWVQIDDENGVPQDCLFMSDRDILYVFEGNEVDEVIQAPEAPKLII